VITLEAVSKRYRDRVAVESLDLEIGSGEFVALVGPSGCGKTTTLRMINRLVAPTSGRILIDGVDTATQSVEALRRGIGYVIQQVGLFPHQTVAENVATVPRLAGWDRTRIERRVDELLDLVGLPAAEYARRRPSELSGGERQRVGVARALGADPPILLMDEPFGAIDPVVRHRLQDELLRLQGIVHKTIVFVTHDIDEAVKLGDRIALFAAGGQLMQYATPSDMLAGPANDFVREFLGGTRTLRALALKPMSDVDLRPAPGTPPPVTVGAELSLRDALDACMRSPDGSAAVVHDGAVIGVIDIERIRELAR